MHMHGLASKDRARVDRVDAALAEAVAPIEDFEIAPQLAENARCRCGAPAAREEKTLPAAGLRQVVIRCLNDGPRCRPEVRQVELRCRPEVRQVELRCRPEVRQVELTKDEARGLKSNESAKARLEARPCAYCKETFQPNTSVQVRCQRCSGNSKILKTCPCGVEFGGSPRTERCPACRADGLPRTCSACGEPFRTKHGRQERCNACKWDAGRPSRSPEQLALDAAVTPEMLAQAHAAKREDRTDLRPWSDLLHAALERLTGERMCAACGETADACRFSLFICPGARTLNDPEIPVSSPVADLAGMPAAGPETSPEPTNEEESPMSVTDAEVRERPACENPPAEDPPLCACGCGQPVQRSNAPYNRGEWRKYATEGCQKKAPAEARTPRQPGLPAGQGPKQSTPPPARVAPAAAPSPVASLPEQGPAALPAFVTALSALLQLTPAQRQAALSAVAALEGVA